jgi:RNA polymerase sigma-70 factor (ECF subfamily)
MDRPELERELARLHAECWGWALSCVGRDRSAAEDALQSAYLRVLSDKAKFRGKSSFKSWVFGIIRMTAFEELRRGQRAVSAESEILAESDPRPGADVKAEQRERAEVLRAGLDRLSPRQREVLQLVFYHEMTIEEAAAVMQISLGSARTHYDRAKKALAERLANVDVR